MSLFIPIWFLVWWIKDYLIRHGYLLSDMQNDVPTVNNHEIY